MSKKDSQFNFRDVPAWVESEQLEQGILDYWDKEQIFAKILQATAEKELFSFYDGPPYATGKPHYGHILQSAIKDTVLRYKTMRGYYVPRRVGWDCHGLPVETLVEKELEFKSKKDIEQYGVGEFNRRCRETVFRYIDDFTQTLQRVGRWSQYDQAYATLDQKYMETEWWVFKQLWEQGLIYEAFRTTPYCVRCATPLSNFEVSMAYKDKTDVAVYVAFPVVGTNDLHLLVWTTTPWTLPGNAGVAYNPEIKYVIVKQGERRFVVAADRVGVLFGEEGEIERELKNEEWSEMRYQAPYGETLEKLGIDASKAFRVVPGEHVTAQDGTGLVHTAPAFGEEDALVGEKEGLPVVKTVDGAGKFYSAVPQWGGQFIFKANGAIVSNLQERNWLWKSEPHKHSYPHCWRCDQPLIYYALDSWFVRVQELKDKMIALNEGITWIPEHIKHGRFGKGMEMAPDWAVSRNRFWSVPLPVWKCDKCQATECTGSIDELKVKTGLNEIDDLHRPGVDAYTWTCDKCGGMMKRVSEVLDVWFDSACMPYAQWHYPFDNQEVVKKTFPADFIGEAIDQTRAWFYVLHVIATALTRKDLGLGKDHAAYKNVIASGLIFAEDGQKLSKKLKNYPEPEPTIAKYGADTLRLYLLTSTSLGEPYRFSEKELQQLKRGTFATFWNVYSFFVRYANTHKWQPGQDQVSQAMLDVWLKARFKQLKAGLLEKMDKYQLDSAARMLPEFIDDLSNWYVRRSRNRFQRPKDATMREEAFGTLYQILTELVEIMAPFMPFVTEEVYRNLTGAESVHMVEISDQNLELNEEEKHLLDEMRKVRTAVSEGLALRARAGIKVRQPLARMYVQEEISSDELREIIKEEVNVKDVVTQAVLPDDKSFVVSIEEARVKVALDIDITSELKQEGWARELVRHGQQLRRQAGYALNERIRVAIVSDNEMVTGVLDNFGDYIANALQADVLERELLDVNDVDREVQLESGVKIKLAVCRKK